MESLNLTDDEERALTRGLTSAEQLSPEDVIALRGLVRVLTARQRVRDRVYYGAPKRARRRILAGAK